MILDTVSHLARVRASVQFKAVGDSLGIKDIVQLAGIEYAFRNRRRRG